MMPQQALDTCLNFGSPRRPISSGQYPNDCPLNDSAVGGLGP